MYSVDLYKTVSESVMILLFGFLRLKTLFIVFGFCFCFIESRNVFDVTL